MRGERWASSRVVAATAAAWFFLGVMVGCGGGGGGTDKCGGKCRANEQCLAVDMETKCDFFGICLKRGYTCVDPGNVTVPLTDGEANE